MLKAMLFHPHVTRGAILTNVIAVATIIAGLAGPLGHLFGHKFAENAVNVCLVVIPFATFIAGVGRSPIKSIDNAEELCKPC
jgi:hypothetical protein